MSRIALFLATLLAGMVPAAEGQQLYQSVDDCIETMSVQSCTTCKAMQLQVDADTRFFVGEQSVTLAQLRTHAAGGVRQLNICRAVGSDRLTRLVMAGKLDTATIRQKSNRPVR